MAMTPTPERGSPKTADQAPAAPGQGLRRLFWVVVITLLMMVISLPTVMLVLFGMLPTMVAWIIDRTEKKYATFSVGGMNYAGLFPYLAEVWFNDHSVDKAQNILTNVFDLMVIYGAAGFGWLIYLAVPPAVTTFLSVLSQRRVTVLRENQAKIIEEWGESVTNFVDPPEGEMPPPPDAGQAGAAAQAQPPAQQ